MRREFRLQKWVARRKRGSDGEMENALTIAFSSLKNGVYRNNKQTQISLKDQMQLIREFYLDTRK